MPRRLHIFLLRLYGRLPRRVRRWLVWLGSPTSTVGAVCVISRDDGAILLVRQVYRPKWGLPGGLLKRREEPVDAAVREVREEVGLDIALLGEPRVFVEPALGRVDVIFRARPADGADLSAVGPKSVEILETRWFAMDELPELQHDTEAALAVLARADEQEHG